MRTLLSFLFCLFAIALSAQDSSKLKVQKAIDAFFEAFHEQDSNKIKSVVSKDIFLQTIGKNRAGENSIRNEDFGNLIASIVGIPDSIAFEEKLLSYTIQIDGAMAHAWTPYEFWINGGFSHCGVNSFQLFDNGEGWKIIYLVDTRRREGCQ